MYLLRKEYKNGPLFFSRKNAEVRLQTLHANGKDNYEIKEIYKYDLDLEEAHDKPRTISVLGEHDIGMVIAYSKD
jgi:hypothetical protein